MSDRLNRKSANEEVKECRRMANRIVTIDAQLPVDNCIMENESPLDKGSENPRAHRREH